MRLRIGLTAVFISLLILLANARAQLPPNCMFGHAWSGEHEADGFGMNVTMIGDFNGDGYEELSVSAVGYEESLGRCYIYSGADQSLLFTVTGDVPRGFFAHGGVAGADLDGDGYSDLLLGSEAGGPGLWTGRVYIFYGGPGPYPADIPAAAADAALDGIVSQSSFGNSIAIIPDIDGDSLADFAVGAYQLSGTYPPPAGWTGKVHVFSGKTLDTLYSLSGETEGDLFGLAVTYVGDANNDGLPDIAVGAPHIFEDSTSLQPGRAYVFSAPTGDLLYEFNGESEGDFFGVSVAGADVNNDGYTDILVGAHHFSDSGLFRGRAYVFASGPGPYPITVEAASATYTYTGEDTLQNLGYAIHGVGDINGDGYEDFGIGSTHWRRGYYPGPGSIGIYSGQDGTRVLQLTDLEDYGNFSYGWSPWTDLDEDGVRDLWIGAPHASIGSATYGPGDVHWATIGDPDSDTVYGECDNCPQHFNPDQANADSDSYGDACDNCSAVTNPDQGITIEMPGDVNFNSAITSADIIYLVGYVFKGGSSPAPCEAAGDVNCDGSVTSADIIYLVAHIFKGGPAPCNVCTAVGLGWSCP